MNENNNDPERYDGTSIIWILPIVASVILLVVYAVILWASG